MKDDIPMEDAIETPAEIILMETLHGEASLALLSDIRIDRSDQRLRLSLLRLIGQGQEETRVTAIKAYAQLYGQESNELMNSLLFDRNRGVVETACYEVLWKPFFIEHRKPDTSAVAQALRVATTDTLPGCFMMMEDLPLEHLPFEALGELLEHENPSVRLSAAMLLANRREPRSKAVLLQALSNKDEDERWGVIDALGKCGDRSVVEEIWKIFILEPDYWDAAARALFRLGEFSVSDLLKLKQERIPADSDCTFDSDCYELLDGLDDEEILDTLFELSSRNSTPYDYGYFLHDITSCEDSRVLEWCLAWGTRLAEGYPETEINYLMKCGDPRVIHVFLQASLSELTQNAFAEGQILCGFEYLISKHLGNKHKAIPTLHEQHGITMQDALLNGPHRNELIEFLRDWYFNLEDGLAEGYTGGRYGLLRMLILLRYDDVKFYQDALKDDDRGICFLAACHLSRKGHREGLDALLSSLSDMSEDDSIWEFWTLARNLIQAGNLVSSDDLSPCISSKVEKTRLAAVIVLGHLDEDGATDLLMETAYDTSPWVRALTARYLADKDDSGVIKVLHSLLRDESEYPRYRAVEAIGKCGHLSSSSRIIPLLADESIHIREAARRVLTGLVADCQNEGKSQ